MHISSDEQLKRFEARRDDPLKSWKLSDDDWENRARRAEYEAAVEDMFENTDASHARWHIVPAESKHYARVHVLERVIHEIERGLKRQGMSAHAP
jgi:AMP-polyphosphate phosphotransferase